MKKAYLRRISDDGTQTLGKFLFETEGKTTALCSMELPWKDNQSNISCIPKGVYKVTTTFSNRFQKDMWLINDVPNREGIRIHSANFARQLNGCIALGMDNADIDSDGKLDIISSRKAISTARYWLGKEFELEIL